MKTMRTLFLAAAVGMPLAIYAAPEAGNGSNGTATKRHGVLLEQRSVYVPVDEHGRVASNDMLVVERERYIPASAPGARAWNDAAGGTYMLVPDLEHSKGAVSPRYHLLRIAPR
jgi:hypothetical protein